MKRRVFTILSAGSLVLWLAVAVLFVRSFWVQEEFTRTDWDGAKAKETHVWSSGGRVGWNRIVSLITDPREIAFGNAEAKSGSFNHWEYKQRRLRPGGGREWYKPMYESRSGRTDPTLPMLTQSRTFIRLPTSTILVALIILPGLWLIRFRCRRRCQKLGLCLECGYDLRASEGKCPECGTAIPADLVRKPIA